MDKLRDKLLAAAIKLAPEHGWNNDMLRQAALNIKEKPAMAEVLFPEGAIEGLSYMAAKADEQMQSKLKGKKFEQMKIREKIAFALKTRFQQQEQNKAAIKAAVDFLIKPQNWAAANRMTWKTASTIWYAAGDTSTDLNHYSKRLILGYIYRMAVLKWINTEGTEETFSLIDKQIDNVMKFEKTKAEYKKCYAEFTDKAKNKDFKFNGNFIPRPSNILKRRINNKIKEYYEYFSKIY